MTKNKILILAIAVLLATNIAMLLFFLNKPGRRSARLEREAALTTLVQQDLGFNQQQLQQFDSLRKGHREQVRGLMDSLRNSKEQELKALGAAGFSDSAMLQSASRSASGQTAMELLMLQHFKSIRSLCTPEQQSKFDTLYYKLWQRKGKQKK
jgi:periplasmic protein CpxP/Spy